MPQKFEKLDGHSNLFRDVVSGIFYVRVMIRGHVKWRSTRKTTPGEAVKASRRILGALEDGVEDSKEIPTLNEYWATYCEAREKDKSERTWKREKQIMTDHYLPQLGKLQLDAITPSDVMRCLNWRKKMKTPRGTPIAQGTLTREQSLLHAVFEAAIDDEHIGRNPLRKVKRVAYDTRQRVVTASEQAKLEAVMTPLVKRFFQFLLWTGIRLEEVRGIDPARDIDWVKKTFLVTGKGQDGIPKTRSVPMIPSREKDLQKIIQDQIADNEGDSKHHRMNRKGTLWAQRADELRQWIYLACDKADLNRFGPHTLRHTFATRYLQGGGDIYILSKILGHASVEVTQRVYSHLVTEDLRARSVGVKI